MKFRLFQRWERASSFGFSALALRVGKKPNVLDRAVAFFSMPHNLLYPYKNNNYQIKILRITV